MIRNNVDAPFKDNLITVQFTKSGAKVAQGPKAARGKEPAARAKLGFGKGSLEYWKKAVYRRKHASGGKRKEGGSYNARISHAQERREIGLGTLCRKEAARKALELWLSIQCHGWEALEEGFLERLETEDSSPKEELVGTTYGEYLSAYVDRPGISHLTADDNRRKVLTLVSEVAGIPRPAKKTSLERKKAWRKKVESVRLVDLSETDFTNWRNACFESLSKGRKCGAMSTRTSPMSVNALIRSYKSVFNEEHRERLERIPLPDPVPGLKMRLLKEKVARYKGGVDGNALLEKADRELREEHPESYKLMVLALAAGLRRTEADLLLWTAFDFSEGCIRVEQSQFYGLKSMSSEGTVYLQPEACSFFEGCFKRRTGDFVLESNRPPKRHLVTYVYYRAPKAQNVLNRWLRKNGIDRPRPTHELRKEFGSLINERYGVYEASRALRHSTVKVTESHYLHSKAKPIVRLDFPK
ncbi:site-specific recombinase, phage integrase family protein [Verrucomicrobiia bacterium DG1235]|nr:site-specific recombinase, phage integrase family protein [Verrucomicrobiae bacterium DG1235]